MSGARLQGAVQHMAAEQAVVESWIDTRPSEGKRAARVYLAAQLQATCLHPDMAGDHGVEMLEKAIDACPEAAKIPEQMTGRTPLLLLCDRDDIHADQLQVLAKVILSAYPPASTIQVRVKGAQGGYRYDTNPIHEVCERADATPALLDVLLDGVDEHTLGQRDSRKRTPLHVLLANPSLRVHEVPPSMLMGTQDLDEPGYLRQPKKPRELIDAADRKAALEKHEDWMLAFMLGAEGGTSLETPRLAMQEEHWLTPLHTLLRNNRVSAPFLAPAIRLLTTAMVYENSSQRDRDNSFKLRDKRNYGVLHTLCERRDFINTATTSEAVEFLEAVIGQPDLSNIGISMNAVYDRGISSHPAATVEDGSRPQAYLPLHYLVKNGSQMPADRLASLLVPMALANREAVRIKDVADFDRCALHVIADRRDVDSHMLSALVQACPESAITKDNRGCTPLHSLLENVMLSHAFTRQQKKVAELKEAIVERDAAIPLQCLLRRWLVRGTPPPVLDATAAERLQGKQKGILALRPWLEPLVKSACSGSEVTELARLTTAAESTSNVGTTAPTAAETASVPAAAAGTSPGSAEKAGDAIAASDLSTMAMPASADTPSADTPSADPLNAKNPVSDATIFLRWEDVESALVDLADPAKLRDAAKLIATEEHIEYSAAARARTLMKLSAEVGFDAVRLVQEVLSTRHALQSLAIARLKPKMAFACSVEENSYLVDLDQEEDLDWENDAVPTMRLIMNLKSLIIDDPETWGDKESGSESDSADDWDDSDDASEPETLDQLLTTAMVQLNAAEREAEDMVKCLVDADARDATNKRVYVTMEKNQGEQIPLRVLLNNTFVAQPVMARLLGFLTEKDKRSAIYPGEKFPHRTPLLLLCADREDITAEMVAAIVTACPDAAAVTDAYDFDAMQMVIERQQELRLDAGLLTDILAVLAAARPQSVIRREVPKMDDAANSKNNAKQIGKRCGRSPVHMVCERWDVTAEMIEALVSRDDEACVLQDDLGRTPLHTLCENPQVSGHLVRTLLKTSFNAASMVDAHGLTPLQSICKSNPGCSVEVLQLLTFVHPDAAGLPDERGQTAAHLLSLRVDITGHSLELMLQVVARAAHNELILQDHTENATALHYLCRRGDVTPQMLSSILRHNSRVASKQDRRRRTALHWLCMDPKASASESDASKELIQVFVAKEKFELPALSSLPKMQKLPELVLDASPDSSTNDAAEFELLPTEVDVAAGQPEPEHDVEHGPYAIQDALELTDENGRTALHHLCRRNDMKPSKLEPLIRAMAQAKPNTVYMRECVMDRQARSFKQGVHNPDRTPLHELLRRPATCSLQVGGGITETLVAALLTADISEEHGKKCGEAVDFFGRTSFHIICSRHDLSPKLRQKLLTAITQTDTRSMLILDDFSEGGVHTLCDYFEATEEDPNNVFASITPEMVSVILEANSQVLNLVDVRGMTAFMHLCANPYVTPELIKAWLRVKPTDAREMPRRLSGDHAARLRSIYLSIDLDGDGQLTPAELADGIHENGELAGLLNLENTSKENIDAIFSAMDGDQNGLISMLEFVNFFESEPVVQAGSSKPGKAAPSDSSYNIPGDKIRRPVSGSATVSQLDSLRAMSMVNNDILVPENHFLLPEELSDKSQIMGSQQQDQPHNQLDYSGSWRAARAAVNKDRVSLDGKDAPASCRMQLVVRRAKAQDRWKLKRGGGVKQMLSMALVSAAAVDTSQQDYPYMAVADTTHGRTALHWLCMNAAIKQRDLIVILVAVATLSRSTIAMLSTESPSVTPLHLIVVRDDAHEDMVRPLVGFNKEAATVRDQMGWLPIQLVYTKPGFKSKSAAAMLALLAAAYPDGCMEPAPNSLIKNFCSLHMVCSMKDVCIESLRAVLNSNPKAAGLRDEHMMVPLHYLCKNTGICMSFRALEGRLRAMKQQVKINTFRLIDVLLNRFSEELCRFIHLNHPAQDLGAADRWRREWAEDWGARELPRELLAPITQENTSNLANLWRDWVCNVMQPLAMQLIQACEFIQARYSPQQNMPGPVFKLHYPCAPNIPGPIFKVLHDPQGSARLSPNWSSFSEPVVQYMKELQQLAAEWSSPEGQVFAAKQATQFPRAPYGYVHAARKAAAHYAKSEKEAESFSRNHSPTLAQPTMQHRAKYSAVAETVQYPSLSAWPAEKHVQFDKSATQMAFGHGRAAIMSKSSRDGHGSVNQEQDVARKVDSIMRPARRRPRRASRRRKQQRPAADVNKPAADSISVFQIKQEDLQESARTELRTEQTANKCEAAKVAFQDSVLQMKKLEEEINEAQGQVVQMIEELSKAEPPAAKSSNRYGRTPIHYLALNKAIPPIFLPAMLRSLIQCDSSVLFLHALATIDTVVNGETVGLQNQRHRTPLHCVVERNDLTSAMVEVCVVSPGEKLAANEVDYWGNTPLQSMLLRRDLDDNVIVEVAEILVKASAACLSVVNTAGLTALHMLVESSLSADSLTKLLTSLCKENPEAILIQESSYTDLGHLGPVTDAQRASLSFKPNDRIDVWWNEQWWEATVTAYTPQGMSRPWRIEFRYVDGQNGALLLDDHHEHVRKAHYRVGDLVDINVGGAWRRARVTDYTPQLEHDPWRVEFAFTDTVGDITGALLLDDDFEKIRIHQPDLSITSARSAAWALRAAAKMSRHRRQKQSEMRHFRLSRCKLNGKTHRTVLHLVCTRTDVQEGMIRAVLQGSSSPNPCATLQDSEGFTALHCLCSQRSATLETVYAYINGINNSDAAKAVESQDHTDSTPLHRLCAQNADTTRLPDMIAALVNASAKALEIVDDQQCTPLHYLVTRTDVTPQMIDALVKPNPQATTIQDAIGRTALHKLTAAKHMTLQLLRSLLPPPSDPKSARDEISAQLARTRDVEERTALHMVCRRRHDFDVDENGQSTMDLTEVVRCIVAHFDEHATVSQETVRLGQSQDKEWDRTALHDACHRRDVNEGLLKAVMLKHDKFDRAYDIHGRTALVVLLQREDISGWKLTSLIAAYTSACSYAAAARIERDGAEDIRESRRIAGVPENLGWVAPAGLNGFEIAELKARRLWGWTPLHELASRKDLSVEMIEAMGEKREEAAKVQNSGGRTPLHTLLSRKDLFSLADLENVIYSMAKCNKDAIAIRDRFNRGLGRQGVDDRTPLHYICGRNDLCEPGVLRSVFSPNPAAAMTPDRNGRLPVHLLLRRDAPLMRKNGQPAGLLGAMIGIAQDSISYKCKQYRGATALHLLAQRPDCNIALLQIMLLGGVESNACVLSPISAAAAVTKTTAIETSTALRYALRKEDPRYALRKEDPRYALRKEDYKPPEPFSDKHGEVQGTTGDDAGWTPLHVLCANPAVSPRAILMLARAVPAAANISDAVGRLPIHLLLENAAGASGEDMTDMLRTLAKVQPSSIKSQDRVHRRTQAFCGSDGKRTSQVHDAKHVADVLQSKINWVNSTPLHVAAARPGVTVDMLRTLLEACPAAMTIQDALGRNALHRLALNPTVTRPLLECAITYGNAALTQRNYWGRTPLASLAYNYDVRPENLADMMGYVAQHFPPAMKWKDFEMRPAKVKGGTPEMHEDRTPLLVLCERPDVSTTMLTKMLEVLPEASLVPDGYGATPLLTISRRKDLSAEYNLKLRAVLRTYIDRAKKGALQKGA